MGWTKFLKFCLLTLPATVLLLGNPPSSALGYDEDQVKSLSAYTMGVIHDLNGDTEEAMKAYERSAKYRTSNAVRLRLAADYARLGKLDEAKVELEALLKEDPQNVQGRYLLALIYTTKKQYDKASIEYETILTSLSKADPQNIEVYGYLAQLYYSQKQYDKAIKQFETIVSLNPTDNADLVYLLGSLYLEVKNREKALELFSRTLKIDPEHDEALNSLAYLYAEDGINLEDALKMVQKALKADPTNGAYLDSLGWIYFKMGDDQKAIEALKKADSYMKDPVIYEHLGDVYFKMGDKENAKKYWDLSIKLLPDQQPVSQKLKSLDSI